MKNYRQLIKELPSKTIVFAFGRFNPPTTGHELLLKVVQKVAKQNGADHIVYASRTQDKKKNPLSVDRKIHYLKLMFKGINFAAANDNERTFIEAVKSLNKKYKNLIMIAGSDRIPEYEKLLQKYNGKDYNFDTIQVVSAGERDPDADDASGMSASKMRALAVKGNYTEFKKGLPNSIRDIDGKLLMNEIRHAMGLESIKEQVKFEVDELREKYFKGEIFHIGDLVESQGKQYEIMDRGSNYLTVVNESGELSKKWIKDVQIVEIKKFKQFNESVLNPSDPHGDYKEKSKALHDLSLNKDVDQGHVQQRKLDLDKEYSKYKKVNEDIQPGPAPKEITYKGYTTKNLHHSADAAKAFQSTIERADKGLIPNDPVAILNALKSTDTYMKLNDLHLEQGQKPDPKETSEWIAAHDAAKKALEKVGEFPHHLSYWEAHKTELQFMEMPKPDQVEESLSTKTLKPVQDKLKVARVIADMLGVDNAEKISSPDQLVNNGLRKLKSKQINKDLLGVVSKMLDLADEVGIDYDKNLRPQKLKEQSDNLISPTPKTSDYNIASDILRYSDFMKLKKMNKGVVEAKPEMVTDMDDTDPNDEDDKGTRHGLAKDVQGQPHQVPGHTLDTDPHLRKMKIKYKLGEEVEDLEEAIKIGSKVTIHAPGKSYHGTTGTVGEIRNGAHKDTPKSYTVYHGEKDATQVSKSQIKLHKEDLATADFKTNPETGRKYRAHVINFANSKANAKPDSTPNENEDENEAKKNLKVEEKKKKTAKVDPVQDDSASLNSMGQKGYDPFFKEETEDEHISDSELDKIVDDVTEDDIINHCYDDDEFVIVDDETGEEIKEEVELVNEVLSRVERMRAKARFARSKSKRQRRTAIALKKFSSSSTINTRARRLAIKLMKQRLVRGRKLSALSVGEKERIEKVIQKRKNIINRLAMRLVPKVRKVEKARLSHSKVTKGGSTGAVF